MSMNVFVSYSHSDGEWARELARELEARGFTTWSDMSVSAGSDWSADVRDAITRCDALVAVVGTQATPAVLTEMGMAFGQGKEVVPVYSSESWGTTVDLASFAAVHSTEATVAADQIASVLASSSGDA